MDTTPYQPPAGEHTTPTERRARFLDDEFTARTVENELRIARFLPLIAGAGALISLWVAIDLNRSAGVISLTACVAIGLYYALLLPRLVFHTKWLKHLIVFNVTLEVTVPALVSVNELAFMGGGFALTSTPQLLTFVAVIGSGLRLNRSLSIYAGVVATVEYLGIYAVARQLLPDQLLVQLPTLGLGYAINHAAYLFLAGLLAALVAHIGRINTRRIAKQVLEKERVADLFGEYVSKQALQRVLTGQLSLNGEKRVVSVMFADIWSFTDMAFTEPPERIVGYLNSFFTLTCDVVARNGGMVNKFIGDGLLAVFGAPDEDPEHASHALAAAQELMRVASRIPRPDGQPTRIGVGVHTGEVIIGSIGSSARKEYTVIGDTVNVAARVEGLTRELDAELLLTEAAFLAAHSPQPFESLGPHLLKGRSEPVKVLRWKPAA